jgi:hypothetical protein
VITWITPITFVNAHIEHFLGGMRRRHVRGF